MTAEVAVMNKTAVALAADSAMTVSVANARKTYPTNKLFALSKHHPIGIMIYNNAEFMNVPWETIVKMYRQQLGTSSKSTVQEYAEDFLGYIGNAAICTDEQCQSNLLRISNDLFQRIAWDVRNRLNDNTPGGALDVSALIHTVVNEHMAALASVGEASSMQHIDADALVREHEAAVYEVIDHRFREIAINESLRQSLCDVLTAFIKSETRSSGYSGLVFAGFGQDEILPSLVEVVTDGSIANTVKGYVKNVVDLDRDGIQTSINAFAQSEMVGRFMNGVDNELMSYLENYIDALLTKTTSDLVEAEDAGATLGENQISAIRAVVQTELADFHQAMASFCRSRFVEPVLGIVSHLPKEELASMAEALVNLTSLKRRVSMEEETVGGPIDVAVISRGDGFIWIKRKHYFDPSLNRDYFERRSPHHTQREANSEVQAV